jgi:hypothetical protein
MSLYLQMAALIGVRGAAFLFSLGDTVVKDAAWSAKGFKMSTLSHATYLTDPN